MGELDELERTIKAVNAATRQAMPLAATLAVNFFKDRFRAQNWIGYYTEPWKLRKERGRKRSSRAILTKTGRLKRSIRKGKITDTTAVIESDTPYGYAHNFGFSGTVTVRQFTRKRYKFAKEQYTTRSGRTRNRRTRQVDDSRSAITVKSHRRRMKLPRRQFIGDSPYLVRNIEREVTNLYIKALRQ